ncbi:MAG TPA: serine/threonine-protein kinase [Solirubrobacterales bacterium]|nr:serine/threonine-protein kinase [Solirubrobacterales bacterium]
MAFDQGYDRDAVTVGIEKACDQHGVKAVIVYELFGSVDVLVRAWIPEGCTFDDLNRTLEDELAPAGLGQWASFEVDCMVRHWPFLKADGSTDSPEDRWILRLQDSEIEEVEQKWPDIRDDLRQRLEDRHLLAPMAPHVSELPGIKFAIEVSSEGLTDVRRLADLEQRLVDILEAADDIAQRSLYSGTGFAQFLIMGRVDYEKFHAIHSNLISEINLAPVSDEYETRTLTHISGQRGYRIAKEGLSGGRREGRVAAFLRRRLPGAGESDRRLEPGEDFGGRYEIGEYLGRGGFADVYEALDRLERVRRALKIFRPPNRESALREMAALRKVNHPNVVKAIWYDQAGPLSYLVTEFIEGKSLDEIPTAAAGGSPRRDEVWALEILIETLRGLEAVHPDDVRLGELRAKDELSLKELAELQSLRENGLVHRDIKPENIMVGEDDHVTIVDFNIASPAYEQGRTRSGTTGYMAPDAGYDGWEPADDLFACGVVLYELILGTHPFPHREPVAGVDPIDPRSIWPELPDQLAQLLLRACNPVRSERFQSASEMRIALEAARESIEGLEGEVRLALWQWRRQEETQVDVSTPEGASQPRTEESIRLARILVRRVEEFPFSNEGSHDHPEAAADGSGSSDGFRGDDDDDDDGDDDDDDDDGDDDAERDEVFSSED